jgi:hypothetical protein
MKRLFVLFTAAILTVTTLSGCYGKFMLTRKVYEVNGSVQDKFLRSAVTWAFVIIPVYGVSALVDFVLFNTIEFWQGKNPIAQGEKEFQYAENGKTYQIRAVKEGNNLQYTISRYEEGKLLDTCRIHWDLASGESVVLVDNGSEPRQFIATLDKGTVQVSEKAPALHLAAR